MNFQGDINLSLYPLVLVATSHQSRQHHVIIKKAIAFFFSRKKKRHFHLSVIRSPMSTPGTDKRPLKRLKSNNAAIMATSELGAAETAQDLEQNMAFMDLYSRQIGAYGLEAMLKLVKMKVLLIGMRGVGVETAKNTVLAGVNTLTLVDPTPTSIRDLGSNFFLSEADVGKPRATVCAPKLAELNSTVNVVAWENGDLTEELVAAHNFVVFTQGTQEEMIRWNKFCRSQTTPIAFMYCITAGASGSVFVDHGPGFLVRDADGKIPMLKMVDKVETSEDGEATLIRYITPDGQQLGSLVEDGLIEFSEVTGMCCEAWKTKTNPEGSINNIGSVRMTVKKGDPKFTFRINVDVDGVVTPVKGLSAWEGGGVITEQKEPKLLKFDSLEHCSANPGGVGDGVVMTDVSFSMVELQLHVAYQSVFAFRQKNNRHPGVNNVEDANEVVTFANEYETKNKVLESIGMPLDEKIVKTVAMQSSIELQPICTFFGGIVAQELVKISGKFTPITQFLNYHGFQCYPDTPPSDTAPIGSRYDDFIAVFGKAMQEKLGNLKIFMVGCGALGCEFVKNFALLGVCCGPTGLLTITDNDTIEISNLNRQFLFRLENVGQPKSKAATDRATSMNPNIKIDARQDLVGHSTEHIFNDQFWTEQDIVCNALDNMQARFYVDNRCVFFEKPLLESGTMGTSANVDVIVPHLTQSYADGGQADEGGGVPMCTLRNFPHLIDHCIEWARAQFEDFFVTPAQTAEKFLNDPQAFIKKTRRETLELTDAGPRATAISNALQALPLLQKTIEMGKSPTMEACVAMAFEVFHQMFRDKIIDLITTYPEDSKTKSDDAFWSGHKKFPQAAEYDEKNQTHVDFVIATANLFACMLKIHGEKYSCKKNDPNNRWMAQYRDPVWLAKVIATTPTPEYRKGKVTLEGDENADESLEDDESVARLEGLLTSLAAVGGSKQGKGFEPADFEKDDDDNFHIEFITACANLRASNYSIPQAPRHKCKMIAGRIIPAIATTTASVTGLVMFEMLKLLQNKPLDQFRNGNYNIGTNDYFLFEANPPKQIKDHVEVNAPDPSQFPDAYDDKGVLKPEYKDPELMLGFAEWVKTHPNPHTKYDKFWIENTADMTLAELRAACDELFKEEELTVSAIFGPSVKIEVEKNEENPSGVQDSARTLWSSMMGGTEKNLTKKWVPFLKELTTRTDTYACLSDPVDVSGHSLYDGLVFAFENDDGDDVTTAPLVLKLKDFKFQSYKDRVEKPATPWL
eukprot:m.181503 g.181503  ORF g.181503 m.181503 type:complete len:1254 (+) comp32069_c2_seq1:380-4141(+)